jgi:hypothetical protein
MGDWCPTRITKVLQEVETSTRPLLVETDTGEAFAKLPVNPMGPHALVCDLIGTQLARWLELPTFDVAIVEADAFELPNGSRRPGGLVLLSRKVKGQPWGGDEEQLQALANPRDLAGLVLLDTWLRNPDRHTDSRCNLNNVFFDHHPPGDQLRLVAMDYTQGLLCNDTSLTPASFTPGLVQDEHRYGMFPQFHAFVAGEHLNLFRNKLRGLTRNKVAELLSCVPARWDFREDIRDLTIRFLVDRAAFLLRTGLPCLES